MTDSPSKQRIFAVILNRESGTLREQWHEGLPDELVAAFAEGGAIAKVRPAAPPDLDEALDEAIKSKPDAVIIGGGDGTVSNAARKLAGTEMPLGILPFGTFNLAARDLELPLDPMEAARVLASAVVRKIDMLEVADQACLCTSLIGFYPALAKREEEYHGTAWWKKSMRLAQQTFQVWNRTPPLELTIEMEEGTSLRRKTRFAAFVPGEYDDIFSVIPKRTGLNEGRMTLYLSHHRSLFSLSRGVLAYLLGQLKVEKDIERVSTMGVTLGARRRRELCVMIDGEILNLPLPLDIRVKPAALAVLKPQGGES
ncbi:diacylglycerol/lipid kinase family protein [Haloferula chungangensis]|uniref:Diacylglycerol/lipid kinase family protein n=1 Tax=Haloferula chungangensis TaxID=1048331 RepID=A0ABW2LA04_9BACT